MKHGILWVVIVVLFFPVGCISLKNSSSGIVSTLRVASYNVRNGGGMDDVYDYRRTADVLLRIDPDVIAIQELDSATERSGGKDVLQELATRTRLHAVYAPAIAYKGGKYGIGVLSKEKPLSHRYLPLPGREEQRALLIVEFERYVFACTHLSLTEADRMASLAVIRGAATAVRKPFFLAGDMNAHPDSDFITTLQHDFVLLSDTAQHTFPANKPNRTIDYIALLKNNGFSVETKKRYVEEEPAASDHRPVVVDLEFVK